MNAAWSTFPETIISLYQVRHSVNIEKMVANLEGTLYNVINKYFGKPYRFDNLERRSTCKLLWQLKNTAKICGA